MDEQFTRALVTLVVLITLGMAAWAWFALNKKIEQNATYIKGSEFMLWGAVSHMIGFTFDEILFFITSIISVTMLVAASVKYFLSTKQKTSSR